MTRFTATPAQWRPCSESSCSLILGSKGRASIKACRIEGENAWRWKGRCDPNQFEHDRFFAAIRSGQPMDGGDYMVRSTLAAIMGQISCYTGQEVTWEAIHRSDFRLVVEAPLLGVARVLLQR